MPTSSSGTSTRSPALRRGSSASRRARSGRCRSPSPRPPGPPRPPPRPSRGAPAPAAERALEHALEVSEVEVPEVLVQDELDHMIGDLRARAAERGLAWERFLLQAKRTEGEIREKWRPEEE